MNEITKEKVLYALKGIKDPTIDRELISLNAIEIDVNNNFVNLVVHLKRDAFAYKDELNLKIEQKLRNAFGDNLKGVNIEFNEVESYQTIKKRLEVAKDSKKKANLGYVVAITSGKGGVGKSAISVNLAYSLIRLGYRVGLLDGDIYGPSIPTALNLEEKLLTVEDNLIKPLEKNGLKLVSVGFMLPSVDTPLIWRGPMLHKAINELVNEVNWGDLDFLIVDLPPGTGDAILSLNSSVSINGSIVITTGQRIANVDVMKNINTLKSLNIPILGLVINMAYFVCPSSNEKIYLFGKNRFNELLEKYEIELLVEIPFKIDLANDMEEGLPTLAKNDPDSELYQIFNDLSNKIIKKLNLIRLKV
ncbi:MAG: Mrp/NBP35 family ATP-binding protein [bacterium]|jgi:ATP-binding protein involved in chromosome partitioning